MLIYPSLHYQNGGIAINERCETRILGNAMSVKINGNGAAANAFIEKVESLSNQELLACYQCGKCSAGCPIAIIGSMRKGTS